MLNFLQQHHQSILKNTTLTLGAGVLAVGCLHLVTECYVKLLRPILNRNQPPLCYSISNYNNKNTSKIPKVIITGGIHGLGFELVQKFVKLGFDIEVWDLKEIVENQEKISEFMKNFSENEIKMIKLVSVDVSKVQDIQKACQDFLNKNHGDGPDLLILNAGIVARKSMGEFKSGEIEKCFATNVTVHCFELLNIMLPRMLFVCGNKASNNSLESSLLSLPWRRSIILLSSVTSFSGFAYASEYCATKAALVSLGDSLRSEIRQHFSSSKNKNIHHQVDVLTVCPYLIGTKMFDWCRPPFWFYSALKPKWVADQIVDDGIRYGRTCLVLPWFFNLMPVVKWVLPDWCWLIADDLLSASTWLKPPVT